MYIPRLAPEARSLDSGRESRPDTHADTGGATGISWAGISRVHGNTWALPIVRRQFSDNPVENTNIRIGIAVGVLLGVFLVATLAFLWTYRFSVRCSKKRHKGRVRKSSSSKSSKAASDNGGEAPAPPPEPAAAGPPAEGGK